MEHTSKDLLELEQQKPSFLETSLLLCNKDQSSQSKSRASRNVGQKPLTTPVPASQVLGKVKDFLGVMAEANKRLELGAQENSSSNYDIEVLTGNGKEYIEMDLVLGVADLHTPEAVAAAESAISGSQPSMPLSANIDSDSEDSDSEDGNNDADPCSTKEIQRTDLGSGDSLSSEQPKKRPKVTELN